MSLIKIFEEPLARLCTSTKLQTGMVQFWPHKFISLSSRDRMSGGYVYGGDQQSRRINNVSQNRPTKCKHSHRHPLPTLYLTSASFYNKVSAINVESLSRCVPKILTLHGMSKLTCNLIFGILRCSAFWICITLWGQKWTVWPWESIFSQKLPKKQRFRRQDFRITWLRRGLAPTILKIETFPACVSENLGHKLSNGP